MLSRSPLPLLGIAIVLIVGFVTPATGGIPDPSRSSCTFPGGGIMPCPDPVTVNVTLRDAFDIPVPICSTSVSIELDTGSLAPEQIITVGGFSSPSGVIDLVFPDGILGSATATLVVRAHCGGMIQLCESQIYVIDCSGPTPVAPKTWGRVKSGYR